MVHNEISEGQKPKPRGRPFGKGNYKGKIKDKVLDSSGYKASDNGENIDKIPIENINLPTAEEQDQNKESTLEDCIEFKNGENNLSLRFSKRHNRMYRIQIFLNDIEVRPMTYTGSSMGYSYWNLLKASLKK